MKCKWVHIYSIFINMWVPYVNTIQMKVKVECLYSYVTEQQPITVPCINHTECQFRAREPCLLSTVHRQLRGEIWGLSDQRFTPTTDSQVQLNSLCHRVSMDRHHHSFNEPAVLKVFICTIICDKILTHYIIYKHKNIIHVQSHKLC
jgi:hypothetical protein